MNWLIREVDEVLVKEVASSCNIHPALARFLVSRGFSTEFVTSLIDPSKNWYSPFKFSQMERAVDRILRAIKGRENILIFGDYDVDGVTSSAMLYLFLRMFTDKVSVFIPHRIEHGYGLTKGALTSIPMGEYSLVVTVDCGINSFYEVSYLKSCGVDVIITDHHEPGVFIPPAVAVINPKLDDSYPFRDLAGCGVVLKLIAAVAEAMGIKFGDILRSFLPYVAVGTIGDSMVLLSENRFFVKYGLKRIKEVYPFRLLLEKHGLGGRRFLTVEDVAFSISPRINSPGRIDSAFVAFNLLVEEGDVEGLVEEIEKLNQIRQREQQKVMSKVGYTKDPFYMIYGEDIHPGIISIVASKVAFKFGKPAFVISLMSDYGKGSARARKGVNLYSVFKRMANFVETWGGHEIAVGFVIKKDNIENFRRALVEVINHNYCEEDVKVIAADGVLKFKDFTEKFFADLLRLYPFGEGFEYPLFAFNKVEVIDIKKNGWKKRILLKQDNIVVDAITDIDLKPGFFYDILASPMVEESDGKLSILLRVEDAK